MTSYDKADFLRHVDVSRETSERLSIFHDLLVKWNRRINLISASTEGEIWQRHIEDSAQLWPLGRTHGHWVDLGAGAGFPGLIVAALAVREAMRFTLVESDQRKAAFLFEANRAMGLDVRIVAERIETVAPLHATVLSARALAPLDKLLEYTEKHRRSDGMALFPKGRTVHNELTSAAQTWRFDHRLHPSNTDPGAAIVEVGALTRA